MLPAADFDGGICCLVRGDPLYFTPGEMLTCERIELIDAEFDFVENEEIIGHVIQLNAKVKKVKVGSKTSRLQFSF